MAASGIGPSSQARAARWCVCLERTKANQILTSSSFMAPFHFLFQERVGDLIRRERCFRICRMMAPDQGQFHPQPAGRVRYQVRLGQAAAKNLSRHVFEFASLLHGPHFHGAQEIIGDVEGRFHGDNFPAFQLSVKLPCGFGGTGWSHHYSTNATPQSSRSSRPWPQKCWPQGPWPSPPRP